MYREMLVALLFTGCVHEQSFLEQVAMARVRWEHATCRTPKYRLVSLLPRISECGPAKDNFSGCYDRHSGTIEISKKIALVPGLRYQVITHEMGHSLGPSTHVPDDTGLMSPYTDHSLPTITEADLDLICQEIDCPCRNPESP